MKKEEFTALGISEELAAKAEAASLKELEGYVAKEQLDTANAEKKLLQEDIASRDKQLEELKKSSGDNRMICGVSVIMTLDTAAPRCCSQTAYR